jgi:hypothetical protein
MRRRLKRHASYGSSSIVPTNRLTAAPLAQMPTTLVRHLISAFNRSFPVVR